MGLSEREWLGCDNSMQMLQDPKCKRSPRKRRLVACACARGVLHLLAAPAFRKGVEVAERFADGEASDDARHRAAAAVMRAANDFGPGWHPGGVVPAAEAVHWTLGKTFTGMKATLSFAAAALATAERRQPFRGYQWTRQAENARLRETKAQCTLLRDIFGNPFRPVSIDPACRKWHDGTVPRVARRMYECRDFASMPILADALEEAGCTNADILNHCRGRGPHVRGCWVVDLVLGKS